MRKPESVLENEMPQILWDFKIQTDHQIPERRRGLVDFTVSAEHRMKINTWTLPENKKLWNMRMTGTAIVVGALGTLPKT